MASHIPNGHETFTHVFDVTFLLFLSELACVNNIDIRKQVDKQGMMHHLK